MREFFYLEDKVNVSGGWETAVAARARLGWVKFKECGSMLCGERNFIEAEREGSVGVVCELTILYGSEI